MNRVCLSHSAQCTGIPVMCLGSRSDGAVHVGMVISDCQFDRDHVRDKPLVMSVMVFLNWLY